MGYAAVTLDEFYRSRESFRVPGRQGRQPEFLYPIQPGPTVTVLVTGFRPSQRVRVISDVSACDLKSLRGSALAAPVGVLRDLAVPGRVLDYAVVAFTGPRFGVLTQDDRDLFWNTFEVPVFEQFLGINGEVLAAECEAHEGLHVEESYARFEEEGGELMVSSRFPGEYWVPRLATGIAAQSVEAPCPCGKRGARLIGLAPLLRGRATHP